MEKIHYKGYRLWALPGFLSRPSAESGRCGPGKHIGDRLVPETIWGLSITPACAIHDDCYEQGADRQTADAFFLLNMSAINNQHENAFMRWLRGVRINTYYRAVTELGQNFYRGKQ